MKGKVEHHAKRSSLHVQDTKHDSKMNGKAIMQDNVRVKDSKQQALMGFGIFYHHRASQPLASTREQAVVGVEGTTPSQPLRDDVVDDIDDFLDKAATARRLVAMNVARVGVGVSCDGDVDVPSPVTKLVVSMKALGVADGNVVLS